MPCSMAGMNDPVQLIADERITERDVPVGT